MARPSLIDTSGIMTRGLSTKVPSLRHAARTVLRSLRMAARAVALLPVIMCLALAWAIAGVFATIWLIFGLLQGNNRADFDA